MSWAELLEWFDLVSIPLILIALALGALAPVLGRFRVRRLRGLFGVGVQLVPYPGGRALLVGFCFWWVIWVQP